MSCMMGRRRLFSMHMFLLQPAVEGVEEVSESKRSSSIRAAAPSPNEQMAQPENGSNETLLQLLQVLTRELSGEIFSYSLK